MSASPRRASTELRQPDADVALSHPGRGLGSALDRESQETPALCIDAEIARARLQLFLEQLNDLEILKLYHLSGQLNWDLFGSRDRLYCSYPFDWTC